QGLALEAIAACKAILELDPKHTETQLFLARMYARVPDAGGASARIARPLQGQSSQERRADRRAAVRRGVDAPKREHPLELVAPKNAPEAAEAARREKPTVVGPRPEEVYATAEMDPT